MNVNKADRSIVSEVSAFYPTSGKFVSVMCLGSPVTPGKIGTARLNDIRRDSGGFDLQWQSKEPRVNRVFWQDRMPTTNHVAEAASRSMLNAHRCNFGDVVVTVHPLIDTDDAKGHVPFLVFSNRRSILAPLVASYSHELAGLNWPGHDAFPVLNSAPRFPIHVLHPHGWDVTLLGDDWR